MSHALGAMRELHLGKVLSNEDPESRGRVEVELFSTGLTMWASVVTSSAGQGYGVSMLPKVDEIVVLAFLGPDEGNGFVLGSVWAGSDAHPSDDQPVEDIYSIRSPQGSRVTIDETSDPTITVETPGGAKLKITDEGGGNITLEAGSETIEMSPAEIKVTSSATVKIDATTVEVNASIVNVNSGMSKFSGVVQADTLIATSSVVSPSYTPGAGNVW